MKISKSKRELARMIIDSGTMQFPSGASWAAQDCSDARVFYYTAKPVRAYNRPHYSDAHHLMSAGWIELNKTLKNWHQTCLSRAEFDQIVSEVAEQSKPDADGWIEWKGGECPVDGDLDVCVKFWGEDGISTGKAKSWSWLHCGKIDDIVAYRPHKPEQTEPQYCESVMRTTAEPVAAQTLDQLLQDYRNAADFAATKQTEADEAAKMRDERWQAVQGRAFDLRVRIIAGLAVDAEMREPELAITDWRDLRIGDEIEVVESNKPHCNGLVGVVSRFDKTDHQKPIRVIFDGNERNYTWPTKWRFIRRP